LSQISFQNYFSVLTASGFPGPRDPPKSAQQLCHQNPANLTISRRFACAGYFNELGAFAIVSSLGKECVFVGQSGGNLRRGSELIFRRQIFFVLNSKTDLPFGFTSRVKCSDSLVISVLPFLRRWAVRGDLILYRQISSKFLSYSMM
jgi:hypothetical protein